MWGILRGNMGFSVIECYGMTNLITVWYQLLCLVCYFSLALFNGLYIYFMLLNPIHFMLLKECSGEIYFAFIRVRPIFRKKAGIFEVLSCSPSLSPGADRD